MAPSSPHQTASHPPCSRHLPNHENNQWKLSNPLLAAGGLQSLSSFCSSHSATGARHWSCAIRRSRLQEQASPFGSVYRLKVALAQLGREQAAIKSIATCMMRYCALRALRWPNRLAAKPLVARCSC